MSVSADRISDLQSSYSARVASDRIDNCPWCDQPIPPEKLAEISGRMAAREHELLAEAAGRLKEQFTRERTQVEAKAKSELEQARKEAADAAEKLKREATQRETAIREEALKAAQAAAQKKLAEAESARQKAEAAMQAKLAEAEVLKNAAVANIQSKLLEAEKAKQAVLAGVQTKLAEAEAAKRAAEQQALAMKAAHENEVQRRVQEARDALEKDRAAAVLAEQAKTFEERQKLQTKVQELQRQIENKTAQELGEGAEINLFDTLRAMFFEDRIVRVGQSTAGANIVHEIMHNGQVCGKIVYDTRNRNLWRNDFILKLREDQVAANADHAIFSSNKFPAGARQLHLQDGVVLACPARVVALVELFRTHILQLHELRVSNEAREEKTAALYAFITSERCSQLLDMVSSLVEKILEVDVAEHKAHQSVWEKRGRLLKSVLKAQGDLRFEIDRIVGTAGIKYQMK